MERQFSTSFRNFCGATGQKKRTSARVDLDLSSLCFSLFYFRSCSLSCNTSKDNDICDCIAANSISAMYATS